MLRALLRFWDAYSILQYIGCFGTPLFLLKDSDSESRGFEGWRLYTLKSRTWRFMVLTNPILTVLIPNCNHIRTLKWVVSTVITRVYKHHEPPSKPSSRGEIAKPNPSQPWTRFRLLDAVWAAREGHQVHGDLAQVAVQPGLSGLRLARPM